MKLLTLSSFVTFAVLALTNSAFAEGSHHLYLKQFFKDASSALPDFDAGKIKNFRVLTGIAYNIDKDSVTKTHTPEEVQELESVVPYASEADTVLEITAEKGSCYVARFNEKNDQNFSNILNALLSNRSVTITCVTDNPRSKSKDDDTLILNKVDAQGVIVGVNY